MIAALDDCQTVIGVVSGSDWTTDGSVVEQLICGVLSGSYPPPSQYTSHVCPSRKQRKHALVRCAHRLRDRV
ncbi:hypothetical protein, partial [Xanthomonas citri]|uniref:hypothetical protein n=1 Tax=Xanthomonas citri TaxID=346 RepID=UPI001C2BD922